MTRLRTALVIGSGIAGPAVAMALQKAGIDSVVYEQHPGSAAGIGNFLTLATNGVDALRTLGAEDLATSTGFPTTATVLWSGTGKPLGAAEVSMTLEDGTTGYTLRRADLYRARRDAAENRRIPGRAWKAAHRSSSRGRRGKGDFRRRQRRYRRHRDRLRRSSLHSARDHRPQRAQADICGTHQASVPVRRCVSSSGRCGR